MINKINDINTDTEEGRLALLLLSHVTCTTHSNKTPNETLEELNAITYDAMFSDSGECKKPKHIILKDSNDEVVLSFIGTMTSEEIILMHGYDFVVTDDENLVDDNWTLRAPKESE